MLLQLATDREWKDKAWNEDPPVRVPYVSPYKKKVQEEDNTNSESQNWILKIIILTLCPKFSVILIILASIFLIIVIGCIIELIRNNRAYKRRQRQEDEMWMPPKYTESVLSPPVKMVGFKSVNGKNIIFVSNFLQFRVFSSTRK